MTDDDEAILKEARERFRYCSDYESYARANYEADIKFANGDSINNYQWPDDVRNLRNGVTKPCLTINKTAVHNNLIINDAKQNKSSINIRPIGDGATYQAAQVYNDLIRHFEYRSNAQSVYDTSLTTAVQGGIGYWRVRTDYTSSTSWNQEPIISRIEDPRSVYLDPDIKEADGSDASYAFIFEDVPNELFKKQYPDVTVGAKPVLNADYEGDWSTERHTRVAEYYRKTQKKDRLVSFTSPDGQQVDSKYSDLTDEGKEAFAEAKKQKQSNERDILTDEIMWYKIAGNEIIEKTKWLGIYIPIARNVGTQVTIDGRMDRWGNTRALRDPQRMYNYSASNLVEMVGLQPRSPFVAAAAAIEGLEEYYKTANTTDHSFLPYNHIDEDGNPIPAPARSEPPQMVPAYMQQMDIAEKQMMMATGQYQAQMGENENAKSGVAINARQRQGDRSTYHFVDNQAMAIRFTGKILLDLIPKIMDVEQTLRIMGLDGSHTDVTVDPNASQAAQKVPTDPNQDDGGAKVAQIIFNPSVGTYDVVSDVGPDYATKRQEGANAMMQLAAKDGKLLDIAGDILFQQMDFPGADKVAQRFNKMIPPNLTGDAPDPKLEQAMHMASDKILQQQKQIEDLMQKLKDKDRETDIRAYEAETKRKTGEADVLKQIGNAGPIVMPEQLQGLIRATISEMLKRTPNPDPSIPTMPQGMMDNLNAGTQQQNGPQQEPDPTAGGQQ